MTDRAPVVLAVLPGIIPSTVITVVKPIMELRRAGYIRAKITLESLADSRDFESADVVVFSRNVEPRYAHCLDSVVDRRIPYVYDIDDNFFEIPADSETGRYYRAPDRIALLSRYVRLAALVRVYSGPMCAKVQTLNSHVEKVDGPIDLRLVPAEVSDSREGPTRLVYVTSRRSEDTFEDIYLLALTRVLDEYSGRVEMHFWGQNPPRLRGYKGVHYHSVISDYDRFLSKFARAGYHIGLAPLRDDVFCRSKSNNKFREYGGCGIAGVYSNVSVYSSCVRHEETGLLVPNSANAWYDAMVRLIEDHDLRDKVRKNAQEYVWTHYSQKEFERVWYEQILRVCAGYSLRLVPESTDRVRQRIPGGQQYVSDIVHLGVKLPKAVFGSFSRDPRTAVRTLRWYIGNLRLMIRIYCS